MKSKPSSLSIKIGVLFALLLVLSAMVMGVFSDPISKRTVVYILLSFLVLVPICTFLVSYTLLAVMKTASKKDWFILIGTAIFLGFFVLTLLPTPNRLQWYCPDRLRVVAEADGNAINGGSEVVILGFQIGNDAISYDTFTQQGWTRVENTLTAPQQRPAPLEWKARCFLTSTLSFSAGPQGGQVSISWDSKEQKVSLYAPQPTEKKVEFIPDQNAWKILRIGCVGAAAWLLFMLLASLALLVTRRTFVPSQTPAVDADIIPWKMRLIFILAGVLGFTAVWLISQPSGIWLTGDSYSYASAARHLVQGEGYINMDGDDFVWWPPLYPFVLSFAERQKVVSPLDLDLGINALLFGLTLYLSGIFAWQLAARRKALISLGVLPFLLLNRHFINIFPSLLSEPLFNFLLVLYFLAWIAFFRKRQRSNFLLLCFTASLISLTRYVGVFFVLGGCLAFLLFTDFKWKDRFAHAISFGALSSLPLGLWIAHNWILTLSLTGSRTSSVTNFGANLKLLSATFWDWFLPFRLADTLQVGIVVFLLLFPAALLFQKSQSRQAVIIPALILFHILLYCVLMLVYMTFFSNASLGDRLLSPVFIPLSLLLFEGILFVVEKWLRSAWKPAFVLILLTLTLITAGDGYANFENVLKTRQPPFSDQGFPARFLQENTVLRSLPSQPLTPGQMIYTNCPGCVFMPTNIHSVLDFYYVKNQIANQPHAPFTIIWVNGIISDFENEAKISKMPDISNFLRQTAQIRVIAENQDGTILEVTP